MAAFLPHPQISSRPLQDLPPASPSDQTMFHLNNPPQPSASISNLTESRIQHRVSGDYRNSGIAGFPAGDGALPVPTGPQAHLVNGGLRNRGPLGGAVFEGARSPPGTKSMSCSGKPRQSTGAELCQFRYFTRAVQILQIWPMSSGQSVSLLAFDRRLDRRHAVQVLFQGTPNAFPAEGKSALST